MDIHEKQKQAFLEAYENYADELFRFCLLRVSDKDVSADILQDTFTKTWIYIRDGKEVENFRAFLYHIMRNLIIDYYRKKKSYSLDELFEEREDHAHLAEPVTDDIMLHTEKEYDMDTVKALLNKLPFTYKEVVILRYINDMTIPEISDMLGESANNISVRLHRAVGRLQEILSKEKHLYE